MNGGMRSLRRRIHADWTTTPSVEAGSKQVVLQPADPDDGDFRNENFIPKLLGNQQRGRPAGAREDEHPCIPGFKITELQ